MLHVALKSLFAHKLRMALTAFSIVLGVSFVAGTYVFTDSINSTFNNLFEDVFSGVDVTVRTEDPEFGSAQVSYPESVLDTVLAVDGVAVAEPGVFDNAQLISDEGEPIGGGGPPTFGFSWGTDPNLNPLVIKDGNGRAPEVAGEVVIDVATAENNDIAIGDNVQIQVSGPVETFTVVGLASFGEADGLAGATISAFELEEAQRLFDLEGQYSEINISAEDGVSPEELQERIAAAIPDGLEAVTGSTQTQEQQDDINQGLGFITTALLAFAGVSIFVGAFIIQNTFRITIAQRSKELALLRAIGATKRQVLSMVLSEAFIVSVIASAIGIGVGIAISYAIRGLANSIGLGLPEGELTLLSRTIIVSMIVGVVVTMLSALLPALKASRTSAIEALRENEATSKRKSLAARGVISGAIFVIGAGMMLIGLFGDIASPLVYVAGGVLIQFVAVSIFAPLLSRPLGNLLGGLFTQTSGMPARLARENVKRSPRRTASTASALMIGVSLVVFVSIFAASIKSTIDTVITENLPADLLFQSGQFGEGTVSEQFALDVEAIPEVKHVSRTFYNDLNNVRLEGDDLLMVAIEPDTFGTAVLVGPSEGSLDRLSDGGIIVRSTFMDEKGWSEGQVLTLEYTNELSTEVEIVGTFDEDYDSKFLISIDTVRETIPANDYTAVFAVYENGVDTEEARAAVDAVAEDYPNVQVQDQGEIINQARESINQLLALFWGLLAFAVIIAVLGITNTLALSISERIRELGLLRAVGMVKSQVRTMVRVESVIISLFGATLGIIMGIFFGWAIMRALSSEGLTGFVIPWTQIAVYFAMAAVAGVIASIWPAYRASKINVLDALDFE